MEKHTSVSVSVFSLIIPYLIFLLLFSIRKIAAEPANEAHANTTLLLNIDALNNKGSQQLITPKGFSSIEFNRVNRTQLFYKMLTDSELPKFLGRGAGRLFQLWLGQTVHRLAGQPY